MISPRRFRWSLVGARVLALLAGTLLVERGKWAGFGGFLAGLPAGLKTGGYRRTYLAHWVLPFLLVYAAMLCGSIFFGLRRLRKGVR